MSVESLMAKANEGLNAGRSFGPVIERDGCLIIPVALTAGGGGSGDSPSASGTASGSGFGGVSWPLGIYVVKDGTAKWVPAVDATRVALAVVGVVRGILRLRARHARRQRSTG